MFLTNEEMTIIAPIYWKSKTIAGVCYSSKDAETINISKMMDDAIYAARQIETLYYGDYRKRIKVRLFTDPEPTLESLASSRHVERKTLWLTIVDLKKRLVERHIHSYSWLPTKDMLADVLTKEMCLPQALEGVFLKNDFNLSQPLVNEVKAVGTEIRMVNIRNR